MDSIETIYWLGAGASKDCGGPLLEDFFNGDGEINKNIEDDYNKNLRDYTILKSLYQKFEPSDSNIESFFNFIVNSGFIGVEFNVDRKQYKPNKIINMLEYYICNFVFDRISYTGPIPDYYDVFVKHCIDTKSPIITFNYDCIFDYLIFSKANEVNYGFSRYPKISVRQGIGSVHSGLDLLKLHGSLNWMICKKCKRINIFNQINSFRKEEKCRRHTCDGKLKPMIVPPVWSKTDFAENLKPLWKRAIDILEKTEKLVIIGYSFPEFDLYAWDLLRIAKILNSNLEVEIVNGKDFSCVSLGRYIKSDIIPRKMYFEDYVNQYI